MDSRNENSPIGIMISLRDIYDKVSETSEQLNKVNTKLTKLDDLADDLLNIVNKVNEHESRIRKLESSFSAHNVIITITVAAITTFIGASITGLL